MLVHYYTFRETCAALKKSSSGLKKMLAEGKIKGRKIGGQWRFTEDEINSFANHVDEPAGECTATFTSCRSGITKNHAHSRKKSLRESMKEVGYI